MTYSAWHDPTMAVPCLTGRYSASHYCIITVPCLTWLYSIWHDSNSSVLCLTWPTVYDMALQCCPMSNMSPQSVWHDPIMIVFSMVVPCLTQLYSVWHVQIMTVHVWHGRYCCSNWPQTIRSKYCYYQAKLCFLTHYFWSVGFQINIFYAFIDHQLIYFRWVGEHRSQWVSGWVDGCVNLVNDPQLWLGWLAGWLDGCMDG